MKRKYSTRHIILAYIGGFLMGLGIITMVVGTPAFAEEYVTVITVSDRADNCDARRVVHTAIILDCSGSMEDMRQEAIDAFNEQVSALCRRKTDTIRTITLAKFSTKPHPIDLFVKDVGNLSPLNVESYVPDGMTAMLDAVGATTDKMEREIYDIGREYASVLVIIISDGLENNSKKYDYPLIAERIKRLQDTGRWTFVYIGSNQDLSKVSDQMGISPDNMLYFDLTTEGMGIMTNTTSGAVENYLIDVDSGTTQSTDFFNKEEKTQ